LAKDLRDDYERMRELERKQNAPLREWGWGRFYLDPIEKYVARDELLKLGYCEERDFTVKGRESITSSELDELKYLRDVILTNAADIDCPAHYRASAQWALDEDFLVWCSRAHQSGMALNEEQEAAEAQAMARFLAHDVEHHVRKILTDRDCRLSLGRTLTDEQQRDIDDVLQLCPRLVEKWARSRIDDSAE
jgi:hypothetical protein